VTVVIVKRIRKPQQPKQAKQEPAEQEMAVHSLAFGV